MSRGSFLLSEPARPRGRDEESQISCIAWCPAAPSDTREIRRVVDEKRNDQTGVRMMEGGEN